MAIPEHDATWETDPGSRYEQILIERDQLAGKVNHLEWVIGEKDQQMESGFASSLLSSPTLSVTGGRKFSSEKNRSSEGMTCKLCYITTSDNDFMEKHLMGEYHLRNVERESKKCQDEEEKHFMRESNLRNVEKKLKYQEEKEVTQKEFSVEKIKKLPKSADHVDKIDTNFAADKKRDDETSIKATKENVESIKEVTKVSVDVMPENTSEVTKVSADVWITEENRESISEMTKVSADVIPQTENTNEVTKLLEETSAKTKAGVMISKLRRIVADVNPETENTNKVTKVVADVNPEAENTNEVTKVVTDVNPENEFANEEKEVDCDFCEFFRGEDGKIQKHLIPDHFCGKDFFMCEPLPDVPSGWTEMTSRTTGQSYYRNNLTMKVQWERPTEPVYFLGETHVGELPEGWVEKKSTRTGCPYYVNKATKHRQWEWPTEATQVEASKDLAGLTSKIIEKLPENTPAKTKAGMMISKFRKMSLETNEAKKEDTEIEHGLKLWKQASASWNKLP